MKKLIAIALLVIMICGGALMIHAAKTNENRYRVDAYCEQNGGELIFTYCGQNFIWSLAAGDRIPIDNHVVLLVDNNGTKGFLEDDFIIDYD